MLGIGQDFVVHRAKASVLAGSTLPRLQHFQVHLSLGVIEFVADAFAARPTKLSPFHSTLKRPSLPLS